MADPKPPESKTTLNTRLASSLSESATSSTSRMNQNSISWIVSVCDSLELLNITSLISDSPMFRMIQLVSTMMCTTRLAILSASCSRSICTDEHFARSASFLRQQGGPVSEPAGIFTRQNRKGWERSQAHLLPSCSCASVFGHILPCTHTHARARVRHPNTSLGRNTLPFLGKEGILQAGTATREGAIKAIQRCVKHFVCRSLLQIGAREDPDAAAVPAPADAQRKQGALRQLLPPPQAAHHPVAPNRSGASVPGAAAGLFGGNSAARSGPEEEKREFIAPFVGKSAPIKGQCVIQGRRGKVSEAQAHSIVAACIRQSFNLLRCPPPQPRHGLGNGGLESAMDFEAYGVIMQARVGTKWMLHAEKPPLPPKIPAILFASGRFKIRPRPPASASCEPETAALLAPNSSYEATDPPATQGPQSEGPYLIVDLELVSSRMWGSPSGA